MKRQSSPESQKRQFDTSSSLKDHQYLVARAVFLTSPNLALLVLLLFPNFLSLEKFPLLLGRQTLQFPLPFLFLQLFGGNFALLLGFGFRHFLQLFDLGLPRCVDLSQDFWSEVRGLCEVVGEAEEGLEDWERGFVIAEFRRAWWACLVVGR